MALINLTPHDVVLFREDDTVEKTFPTVGKDLAARVTCRTERCGEIEAGIPRSQSIYGEIVNLPAQAEGIYYIVSRMIISALEDAGITREDLCVPNEQVRNEAGLVVGCRSFAPR